MARRLLQSETIPRDEKMFSIFESYTRWNSKGKAGTPVELGVPVCVLEDHHGFILHPEVMWQDSDMDYAQPMIEKTQARFPDLRWCSSTAASTALTTGFASTGFLNTRC